MLPRGRTYKSVKKENDKGNRNNKTIVKQHEQANKQNEQSEVIKHPYGKQCHSATANDSTHLERKFATTRNISSICLDRLVLEVPGK